LNQETVTEKEWLYLFYVVHSLGWLADEVPHSFFESLQEKVMEHMKAAQQEDSIRFNELN